MADEEKDTDRAVTTVMPSGLLPAIPVLLADRPDLRRRFL